MADEMAPAVDRSTTPDVRQLLLLDIARTALVRGGVEDWTMRRSQLWCHLEPPEHTVRDHGWKLHVSATPLSAPIVLAHAAEVLIRNNCPFKFARTLDFATRLASRNAERGGGGKFITAYPDDDDHLRALAAQLHQATYGLPGPAIMSDRPYRPGSLVYYRYGAFRGFALGNDGSYETPLVGPDGSVVKDERKAWFSPPPWAQPPFPDQRANGTRPRVAGPVLLGGRFLVQQAIRHSYRGGVYRATDQHTGETVVVKQARRHADANLTGSDAHDRLRAEADLLERLARHGIAARPVTLFAQQGDLFLAEELIDGVSLHRWVADRITAGRDVPLSDAVAMAARVAKALALVHAEGVVHRDFTPFNIMVTAAGEVRLIDLEMAVTSGTACGRILTFGYAAPEQADADLVAPAPAQTADLFSLGATILHLASGVDAVLLRDEPARRPLGPRIAALVDLLGTRSATVRALRPLIVGLTADDPDARWEIDRVLRFLDGISPAVARATHGDGRLAVDVQERMIADGLAHLVDTMNPLRTDRLWRSGVFGSGTDPCSVQHGAAGVLSVLTRAAATRGEPALHTAVRTAADWIERRLPAEQRLLPGLYFGRSGTAWALHDAAMLLGDQGMAARAVDLALRIPLDWPSPDICHGLAGAGMAQLYLWQVTGDERFRARGLACAERLAAMAEHTDGGVLWPIPTSFASELAGLRHYGFAHGVAGVATYLLATAEATGRGDLLDLAVAAGGTIAAAADVRDGAAWWSSGEETGHGRAMAAHWCNGSSGMGTFLVRLWLATGEERFAELSRAAAEAVWRSRGQASPATCHGLAGDGQFLLDLADHVAAPRYREWAAELAAWMHVRHAMRDGRIVVPDETMLDVVADYHTGLGGAVDFLLRLRHGGPRPWHPAAAVTPDLRLTASVSAAA
jgi:tRNA A-37 threonylcarbamoyl transferase component Bud32